MFKKSAFRVLVLGSVSALLLSTSACTWLEDWPPQEHGNVFTPQTQTVMPEQQVMQSAHGTWLQTPAQQQAVTVKSQEEKLRELENARRERDAALARLSSLEGQMAQMQESMQTIVPAMNQIAKTQTEMQNEIKQKQVMEAQMAAEKQQMQQQTAMQELQQTMQEHAAMQKSDNMHAAHNDDVIMGDGNQITSPAPQALKGLHVKDFRAGDGPDRTRLVFETNGSLKYEYDLDNNEKLMVLTLSDTHWSALPEKMMGPHALLSSYKAVQNEDGSTSIVMQLKQPIKVEWAKMFTPSAGAPYRLIMDLAAM